MSSLGNEFSHSPNQANPNGNRYFLNATDANVADPAQYELLTQFGVVNEYNEGWETACCDSLFTPLVRHVIGAKDVLVHPGREPDSPNWVIVGWVSPTTGLVRISGQNTDVDVACLTACDGVDWQIRHGSAVLAAGAIGNGGFHQFSRHLVAPMRAGDFLYFLVGPQANNGWDSTALIVNIKRLGR